MIFFSPLLWGGVDGGAFAQRSKDGAKIVATANNIVNEYTRLTANAVAGVTSIKVNASALNANGRFPGNLAPGDLIMIIQIQGATILGAPDIWTPAIGFPYDSTWGAITNYNNCGNNEFAEVTGVPDAITIDLDCPLINSYTGTGRTVVVRVPRYSSLTINNGGSITCDPWNGTIGGVCAIEVQNNTTINAGGSIDVTGNGFRGAQLLENQTNFGVGFATSSLPADGAEKGEGIAGYEADYTPYGGMYARGAPANGGGGGLAHNAGGGGGANGGSPLSWNGHGMPDNSGPNWNLAWNLQYGGFSTQTSTGGGQGGYSFSSLNGNAITQGPTNLANWGGDQRRPNGGYGGRPLDYSTGRLFLGGGGGSGDQNDNQGGRGGNGGALVYLMNYGTVSGAGQIISNGNVGINAAGTAIGNSYAGADGAGGAGAGGTIIVNSVGNISGVSIMANGGKGGDQVITKGPLYIANGGKVYEAEGPGGGGSGGYIGISTGAPARTANGGANGTTNSDALTEFIPNGATKGDSGTTHGVVTNFIINAPNVTICAGQSATLNATLTGTVPGGTTIIWYDAIVAGNVLGTGNTYTTTVLSAGTYTYYVGTCPGTYHQPVIVTAISSPVVSAGPDATICSAGSTTLNASGGTGYAWSPATGLSNPNISNPVATPVSTTTYVVTVASPCGPANDTVIVTVNSSIPATISGTTSICAGGQTTLTASGGGNYLWNTNATTTSIIVSPTGTTNYSVTVSNGSCSSTASVTVTVSSGITASINGPSAVCTGNSATLTASGGTNYLWNTGATTTSITVTPTANTTYTVTVSNGSCSSTASISVNVSGSLTASIAGITTICGGGSTTLTASGGSSYLWSTTATTASINVSSSGTYSVTVSSGNCSSSVSVNVTVSPAITANMSSVAIQCGSTNGTASATAGGGTGTLTYSWNPTGQTTPTATGLNAGGIYTVTISDAIGCSLTTTISVVALNAPFVTVTGNTMLCIGDATTLTASGGNAYSWSTGSTATTIAITPSVTTNYTVSATIGNCVDTATFTVSVLPPPVATVVSNTTICAGQSATLIASGGGLYAWSNGATTSSITISPLTNTSYSVIVSIGSCTDTAAASIGVVPSPTATITSNPASTTICGGDAIILNASGGTVYLWSNGATTTSVTMTPAVTTTYTVNTSNGFCSASAQVTINVLPPPIAAISGNNNLCQGNAATLSASGGGTYSWSSGQTTAVINPSASGSYSVVVTIGTCRDTAVSNITVNPNPTATVSPDITIVQGQSTGLSASGGINYGWNNGMTGGNITVSPPATTVYCVTVYDANTCQDTACVTVFVEICATAGTLYLPNAFSPNGDGDNDSLQIYYGIPACIKDFRIVIFNRWGEKVYETYDPAFRWGGVYNKAILQDAGEAGTEVFTYYMDVAIMDGSRISRKGNISLIR